MAIIRVGDDLIDDETGEYAGPANSYLPDALNTEEDLIAFMHRLMDAESRLLARKAELDAVIANCERMVKREQDRVNWLRQKHEQNAKAIAIGMLPKRKDGSFAHKTFTCPWGNIAFRDVKPTIKIIDEVAASEWAEAHLPEAVRVRKTVVITPVKEYFATTQEPVPAAFEVVEGYQSATFTTVGNKRTGDEG